MTRQFQVCEQLALLSNIDPNTIQPQLLLRSLLCIVNSARGSKAQRGQNYILGMSDHRQNLTACFQYHEDLLQISREIRSIRT